MNSSEQLIKLAVRNIDQVPSANEKIEILNQAANLSSCPRRKQRLRVAANCIFEAESAQLELIKELELP